MTKTIWKTVFLAQVLAAGTVLGAAGVAAAADREPEVVRAAEAGSVSGHVWFDRDTDGVRAADEPGRRGAGVVLVYRDTALVGAYDTDEDGRYAVDGLEPGTYRLTYTDAERYVPTTPVAVDATVTEASQVTVDFGMKGASIAGEQWLDSDFDGIRDAGEPLVDPFSSPNSTQVTGPKFAWSEQDERGTYRIYDLPSGDGYVVHIAGPFDLPLTKEGGDSRFDWRTGRSAPLSLAPGEDVVGMDAGYAEVVGDAAITSGHLTPDRDHFYVGEEFTVELTLTNNGPVPDYLNIEMNWSEGFEVLHTEGLITVYQPRKLYGGSDGKVEPGDSLVFTATMRATAPIVNGSVDVTTTPGFYGDDNPANDRKEFRIRVS